MDVEARQYLSLNMDIFCLQISEDDERGVLSDPPSTTTGLLLAYALLGREGNYISVGKEMSINERMLFSV
jgi:hypothetical protein